MNQYLVWHQGPDEIHPARTWLEAVNLANTLNTEYADWAKERTAQDGEVFTRSWAVPYTLEDYCQETGYMIDLQAHEGDPK